MVKKNIKCKHEELKIFRTTKEIHCSEVKFIKGNDYEEDDGDYDFTYEGNYSSANENPDLFNPSEIEILCCNEKCNKSWKFNPRKKKEYSKLPQFIKQVLDSEEEHIREYF